MHLRLDEASGQASVQVIESIRARHGKKVTVEGALILFPKSPEIIFNVFAVEDKPADVLLRQFTLVNFEDPELFSRVRAKLQAARDRFPNDFTNGHNKLVSQKVRVRATGTFNLVDANQDNGQILLQSIEDLEVL